MLRYHFQTRGICFYFLVHYTNPVIIVMRKSYINAFLCVDKMYHTDTCHYIKDCTSHINHFIFELGGQTKYEINIAIERPLTVSPWTCRVLD